MLLSAEILPSVINADNEMITEGMIGWIIWIYLIKRTTNRTSNTTSEQIQVLCVRTGVSLSELARRINQSQQNFNTKLKRNTVKLKERIKIAEALGVTYEQYFVMANGEQIK